MIIGPGMERDVAVYTYIYCSSVALTVIDVLMMKTPQTLNETRSNP